MFQQTTVHQKVSERYKKQKKERKHQTPANRSAIRPFISFILSKQKQHETDPIQTKSKCQSRKDPAIVNKQKVKTKISLDCQ